MIILKVTKNQGFTFSLEDTFFEKPQKEWVGRGGGGGVGVKCEIDPVSGFRIKLNPINIALLLQEATEQY